MASNGKIVISTQLDNKGLEKGINSISGQFGGLKSVLGKIGGLCAAAFSVKAILSFSKAAIDLGSDLDEVQNVVNVSFGSMASAAEEFASTAVTKFGMSELAAKKTASTYMAMAKGMGVAEGAASDMSIALAGLSGDVASFYNLDQEDAAKKLQGVFTGESEALKSLGVVMTQTNLKQFAMERGMNSNIEAMSQAELVALRYAFVTNSLSLAAGDFERTQDSWANQTRILSMQWQQFMGIIGQTLTTVLTPAIQMLNSLVSVLVSAAQKIKTVVNALFGKTAEQTQEVAAAATAGAAAQESFADGVKEAGKAAKKSTASFDTLNVLQNPSSGSGSDNSAGVGAGAGTGTVEVQTPISVGGEVQDNLSPKIEAFIEKIRGLGEQITTTFAPTVSAWGTAFGSIGQSVVSAGGSIGTTFSNIWNNSLVPFGAYIAESFIPSIVNPISETMAPAVTDSFGRVSQSVVSLMENTLSPFVNYITADFATGIGTAFTENIVPIFAETMPVAVGLWTKDFENSCLVVQEALGWLQVGFDDVKMVFSDMCTGISTNWETYGGKLLQGFTDFKDGLWETWWYIYDNIINPVLTRISDTFDWLWTEHLKPLWDGIVEFALSVSENILALWNGFIKPVVDYLITILSPIVTNVINGIVDAVAIVIAVVADVVKGIIKWLDGFIQFIVGVFTLDWERAWGGVKKMFEGAWGAFEGVVKGVVNAIIWVINQLIAAIYSGIAGVVNGLGSIVSTVGNLLGKNWGFSIPTTAPVIPYLAQGAVLPPNKPFMAVVGDQKNGTNVEAPLETIKQALSEVMATQGAGNITINFTGDLAQLARVLKPVIEKEDRRVGGSIVRKVGV